MNHNENRLYKLIVYIIQTHSLWTALLKKINRSVKTIAIFFIGVSLKEKIPLNG
jgi:hypothetical protein